MRDNTRSKRSHGVATITVHILLHAANLWDINSDGSLRNNHHANRIESWNTTKRDLVEIVDFSLRHMGCCLFDRIASTIMLNKNDWMTRLASPDVKQLDALFRPCSQLMLPGQITQIVFIRRTHNELYG